MTIADELMKLDERRAGTRISVEDWAAKIGVASETLSRWRHGKQKPPENGVELAAEALDALIAEREEILRKARAHLNGWRRCARQ